MDKQIDMHVYIYTYIHIIYIYIYMAACQKCNNICYL